MSNRNNSRRYRSDKVRPDLVKVSPFNQDEFDQVFLGKGTEELTDKLIDELVLKGWEREKLIKYQKEGFRYSRLRNSLIEGEAHFEGFENLE